MEADRSLVKIPIETNMADRHIDLSREGEQLFSLPSLSPAILPFAFPVFKLYLVQDAPQAFFQECFQSSGDESRQGEHELG